MGNVWAPTETQTVFRIPASLFADVDDPSYRVSVSMADGSSLPAWIVFDPNFETITFTPGSAQFFGKDVAGATVSLRITAIDPRGGTVSTTLNTLVTAPTVASTITGAGAGWITGTSASERIDPGTGNTQIEGGGGVDRIMFARGYGQDRLSRGNDNVPYPYGDIVEFGANITLADLTFSRTDDIGGNDISGKNLLVKINGTTDQLSISQQFAGRLDEEATVREFVFADGSRLSAAPVPYPHLTLPTKREVVIVVGWGL